MGPGPGNVLVLGVRLDAEDGGRCRPFTVWEEAGGALEEGRWEDDVGAGLTALAVARLED